MAIPDVARGRRGRRGRRYGAIASRARVMNRQHAHRVTIWTDIIDTIAFAVIVAAIIAGLILGGTN